VAIRSGRRYQPPHLARGRPSPTSRRPGSPDMPGDRERSPSVWRSGRTHLRCHPPGIRRKCPGRLSLWGKGPHAAHAGNGAPFRRDEFPRSRSEHPRGTRYLRFLLDKFKGITSWLWPGTTQVNTTSRNTATRSPPSQRPKPMFQCPQLHPDDGQYLLRKA